ncbi:MAG: hypothetical protein EOM52_07800 [Clostridia bacterium]|nr:hypothetical protein [Clostridia bacterium]
MASSQTEHYGLNQWEGTDHFLREEFNEDNRKVDAVLGGIPEIVFGTYYGAFSVAVTDQWTPVHLGYRPNALIAFMKGGANLGYLDQCAAQMVARECPDSECLRLTSDGFEVRGMMNVSDARYNPYRFLALK